MPSGSTTINFGAWPGSGRAATTVSGQTGLVVGTRVEAFVLPVATADHSDDEHRSAELKVQAYYVSDGVLGIEGFCSSKHSIPDNRGQYQPARLHGQYTIGWAWSNS